MRRSTTGVPQPPSWTDRDEQLSAGFYAIRCHGCTAEVLVRKMNPAQTSTQWSTRPTCAWLQPDASGVPGERCPALTQSIESAIGAGVLPAEPLSDQPG